MPHITTHLMITHLLTKKLNPINDEACLAGSIYPDQFLIGCNLDQSLALHYKKEVTGLCDLVSYRQANDLRDSFNLGVYFHLWFDNYVEKYSLDGINKQEIKAIALKYLIDHKVRIHPAKSENRYQCTFEIFQTIKLDDLIDIEDDKRKLFMIICIKQLMNLFSISIK